MVFNFLPKNNFSSKKILQLIFLLILLLVGTLLLIRIILEQQIYKTPLSIDLTNSAPVADTIITPTDLSLITKIEPPLNKISFLNGQEISLQIPEQCLAVVIENSPQSRPQMQGLVEAPLVYETPAEGGVTRFLAIFDDPQELVKIGPVRSARSYLVDFAENLNAIFVHAGGSPAALEQLRQSFIPNFSEDYDIVYRDPNLPKPHNLFVNLVALTEFFQQKPNLPQPSLNLTEPIFDFMGKIPAEAQAVEHFALDFSYPQYFVAYAFDNLAQDYQRKLAQVVHTDALQQEIRPVNIIIKFIDYWVADEAGRLAFAEQTKGVAWFFSGGQFWQGTWQKLGDHIRFLNTDGSRLSLNPGQTFIEVINDQARVQVERKESFEPALTEELAQNA